MIDFRPIHDRRAIGPVLFEVLDRQGAVQHMLAAIRSRSPHVYAFCNMHTFNLACRTPAFASALAHCTVFNDGLGIDAASRILYGRSFPENLNGTDLTPELLQALDAPTSLFLVGSPPGVAELAATAIQRSFPLVSVVGTHHGFFTQSEGEALINRIHMSKAEILLVGMGNPRQELWAIEIVERTRATIICVGAYLDFASGRIPRAPKIVRMTRTEWLYRLAIEPARLWRRYIYGAPRLLYTVLEEKIARRRRKLPSTEDHINPAAKARENRS